MYGLIRVSLFPYTTHKLEQAVESLIKTSVRLSKIIETIKIMDN